MKYIYLTITALLFTAQVHAQLVDNKDAPESKKDTAYSAQKDTMIIRVSEKATKKLLWEDFYVKHRLIAQRNFYYVDDASGAYGYAHLDRRIGKHKNDYRNEFYKNGVRKIEAQVHKGKLQGKYVSYYPSGKLQSIGHYKLGNIDSTQVVYFESGKISATNNYLNGKKEGMETIYHQNGQLWSEKKYSNGNIVDMITLLDETGKPLDKGTLKGGNGTVLYYTENGILSEVDYYANGKFVKTEKKVNSVK
jgi:antitoxin component YwqK of YwqJK toxin-antitoxin module